MTAPSTTALCMIRAVRTRGGRQLRLEETDNARADLPVAGVTRECGDPAARPAAGQEGEQQLHRLLLTCHSGHHDAHADILADLATRIPYRDRQIVAAAHLVDLGELCLDFDGR